MTFDEWKVIEQIILLPDVCEHEAHYQHILEMYEEGFVAAHVMTSGFFVELEPGVYHCLVACEECVTPDIEEVRKFLWDNHSKYEM